MDEVPEQYLSKTSNHKLYINTVYTNTLKSKIRNVKYLKKNRRPLHVKNKRSSVKDFRILSYNVTSLQSRLLSLSDVLNKLKPKLWCLQETHMRKPGNIKFSGSNLYQIYELTRSDKGGGGLAVGVSKELQSVWVRQGEGEVEALTVMVTVSGLSVRVTNAYGPQEYDSTEKKNQFWQYLQDEVNFSGSHGVGCIITMDANSWLGSDILKNDVHQQNRNGKLFETFLNNNENMHILNNQHFCDGNITRTREVNGKEEKSILDFILTCDKVLPFAKHMYIDEKRIYAVANFCQKKKGKIAKLSDHNLLYADFDFKFKKITKDRRMIFRFNDLNALKKFKDLTSRTNSFTNCFSNEKSFKEQIASWEKVLKKYLNICFKKVRIKNNNFSAQKNKSHASLFSKRTRAMKQRNNKCQEQIESEIQLLESEKYRNIILENVNQLKDKTREGFLKLKNKLFPKKQSAIPSAKRNIKGQIITNYAELKKLYLDHFKFRLRERPLLSKYKSFELETNEEFKSILQITQNNILQDWSESDLDKVLKCLKPKQSQDSRGWANEIFCYKNIGNNLKSSLLIFCNKIKNTLEIPSFFQEALISAIPKRKKIR